MTQIASEDYVNKLIYLHVDTVVGGFNPSVMQQEHRALRRLNAGGERGFNPMVKFSGFEAKGGGKFTSKLTQLRAGVRIVPHDSGVATEYNLDILNELVNIPDGISDRDVFDRSGVAAIVNIDPIYTNVEIVKIAVGSGLDAAQQLQLSDIHGQVSRAAHLDQEQVADGLAGYQQAQFNNWTSTIDYIEANGLKHIVLTNNATADRQIKNVEIRGINFPTLDTNDQLIDRAFMREMNVTGNWTGLIVGVTVGFINAGGSCRVLDPALVGTFSLADGVFATLSKLRVVDPLNTGTFDFITGAAGSKLQIHTLDGNIKLENMDHSDDVADIHVGRGQVEIAASCTAGIVNVTGVAKIIRNENGTTVLDNTVLESLMDRPMENGETFEQQQLLMRAAAAGNLVQLLDGSYKIKSADGSKNRIEGDDAPNGGRTISSVDTS